MRIGFLSTDWGDHADMLPGGCTWIRMMHPQMALRNAGVEVFIGEVGWIEEQGFVVVHPIERLRKNFPGVITKYPVFEGNLDVVVLKLFMHKDACYYIDKARALGQTVIIDTDDHFENLPSDNLASKSGVKCQNLIDKSSNLSTHFITLDAINVCKADFSILFGLCAIS